jgi:hypothetical protein
MRNLATWMALVLTAALPGAAWGRTYFLEVTLPTNDIVYDPHSDKIYASVPSTAGATRGNTITPIDPHTGVLGTSVFVSSEPSILALADDGSRVYVASESTNLVTPFSLATMTPGTAFPIGIPNRRVADMEAAPGNPNALAVSRRFGGNNVGIAVFVDGAALPMQQSDAAINDRIEFGATAATLYGHANSFSEFDFNSFPIDLSPTGGIGPANYHVKHLVGQFGLDMEYDNGRMYFTNGQVLDVAGPGPIGSFASGNGPVEPESSVGRTYFISDGQLKAFSQTTFVPIGSLPIPGLDGSPRNLISLGDDGLAFATSAGKVYIARGSLIEGPTADFNEDNQVDGADFLLWQAGLGVTDAKLGQGDADGNGKVDAADLAVWKQQFGTIDIDGPAGTRIPEPSGLLFVLPAAARIAALRRCQRQSAKPRLHFAG